MIDSLLALVKNKPLIESKPTCPFCDSTDLIKHDTRQTTLGGIGKGNPNHFWEYTSCTQCQSSFLREHKDGNVWYTQEDRVLKGIPSCYENYILTCAGCDGDVRRRYTQLDGETPLVNGVMRSGPDGKNYRCFFSCDECGVGIEYPNEYWRRSS